MTDRLFVLTAEGIAGSPSTDCRLGARHALMLFVAAECELEARTGAEKAASSFGWLYPEVNRCKEIEVPPAIADEVLCDAANYALEHGSALITYQGELRHDA